MQAGIAVEYVSCALRELSHTLGSLRKNALIAPGGASKGQIEKLFHKRILSQAVV
jgi:hypothetical protein